MSIEDVLDDIVGRATQASTRLSAFADYARARFAEFGLPDVRGGSGGELRIRGLARAKDWDVAYNFAGKDRLLVSLKSIWSNAGGTIPNRLDDLMGEAANIQQMAPEIVIGYIMLFDTQADSVRRGDGQTWSQYLESALKRIAIRKAPLWNQGLIEGIWLIRFDSKLPFGSRIVDPTKTAIEEREFFLSLLRELRLREPAIPFTMPIPNAPTEPPGD
jgi:hypothetical protein